MENARLYLLLIASCSQLANGVAVLLRGTIGTGAGFKRRAGFLVKSVI